MTIFNESPFVFFSYKFQCKDGSGGWGHLQLPFTKPVTIVELDWVEEYLRSSSDYEWVSILYWRRLEQENDPTSSG